MSDLSEILYRMAETPDETAAEESDAQTLFDAIAIHPYFSAAAVALLRHWPKAWPEEKLTEIRNKVALAAADRHTLFVAKYGDEWAKFYPEEQPQASHKTIDVIDTFLQTYGSCTPEEEAQLERLIFNPTPDYAEMLARQEQQELPDDDNDIDPRSQDALINAFIRSQHPKSTVEHEAIQIKHDKEEEKAVHRPEHTDDSLLSESLAKIFIKQGRYERAFEIISGLNLKFPKKSAYFADQLRFLQKLIINQRRLAELNGHSDADKN